MKLVIFFSLFFIFLRCQAQNIITIGDSKEEQMEKYIISYQLKIPGSSTVILITTIPIDPNNQINFFINTKKSGPTYSTSTYKAENAGRNELLIKLEGSNEKNYYLDVYSTKQQGKFQISVENLDNTFIKLGQELVIFPKTLATFYYKPLDTTSKLLFYAVSGHIEDFSFELKLKKNLKSVQTFTPSKLFKSGYGLELDLALVEGLESTNIFDILFSTFVNPEIKFGIMTFNKENKLEILRETFGYLRGNNNEACYSISLITDTIFIIHIASYPYPININIVDLDEKTSSMKSNAIDTLKLFLTSQVKQLCFAISNESPFGSDFIYTYIFQIYELATMESLQKFLAPIQNGITTKYFIPPGQAVGFRRKRYISLGSTNSEMHMFALNGNPILHMNFCLNYPCQYTKSIVEDEKTTNKFTKADKIGKNSYISIPYWSHGDVGNKIKMMSVVNCISEDPCEFYLSVNDDFETVELFSDIVYQQTLSQYSLKGFSYSLYDQSVSSVNFILDSFTGDTTFTIKHGEESSLIPTKMFRGNKKIITFTKDTLQSIIGDYEIVTKSNDYSFYSISISINGNKPIQLSNGIIQLQFISMFESTKLFQFQNSETKTNKPFIISINPLNCQINCDVNGKLVVVSSNEQIVIFPSDIEYKEILDVKIVFDSFISDIKNEKEQCLFYISGIEADSTTKLLLNEGVNHKAVIKPNTITSTNYFYPLNYGIYQEHVVIDIIYRETSIPLEVTVLFEGNTTANTYTNSILKDEKLIFTPKQTANCITNYLCKVFIEIKLKEPSSIAISYLIHIHSFRKKPLYLKPTEFKQEFTLQQRRYYYTDIGLNEKGTIMVNPLTHKTSFYARIVKKDLKEKYADWNDQLILPNEEEDFTLLLPYDYSNRVFTYSEKETSKCGDGCDLYITIIPEDYPTADQLIKNEYSILFFMQKKDTVYPLRMNEPVYGTIGKFQLDAYSITVPFETEEIRIHLVSEIAKASISLTSFSTVKSKEWEINDPKGIQTLTKTELGVQSLKGQFFIIIISSIDLNQESSGYGLQVTGLQQNIPSLHYSLIESNEICSFTTERLTCNYIRFVSFHENINNIQLSIDSIDNRHNSFVIFAKTVDKNIFDTSFTSNDLPQKKDCDATTENQFNKNVLSFAFTRSGDYYIIVSVYASQTGKAILISTSINTPTKIMLTPTTKKTYSMKKGEVFTFALIKSEKFLVQFTPILGQGILQTGTDEFTISLDNSLLVEVKKQKVGGDFTIEAPTNELTYQLEYCIIDTKATHKIKEISFGKENKIIAENGTFDSSYYVKVLSNKENKDIIAINVKFPIYKIKEGKGNESFNFIGYITDSLFINQVKKNPSLRPEESKKLIGQYNSISRNGQIIIKNPKITNSISEYYVLIELTPDKSNQNIYEKITTHITTQSLNNLESIYDLPRNKYYSYSIEEDNEVSILKLSKSETQENVMIIEFSDCLNLLDFAIRKYSSITNSEAPEIKTNDTDLTITLANNYGKVVIEITLGNIESIGFVVFKKKSNEANKALSYFIKYKTGVNIVPDEYKINQESISVQANMINNKIKTTLFPVYKGENQLIQSDYVFRVRKNDTETMSSICILPNSNDIISIRNTTFLQSKENITFNSVLIFESFTSYHVYVVATFITETEEEILMSYKPQIFKTEKLEKDDNLLIIIICSVIGSIVVILIGGFFTYYYWRKRNENNTQSLLPAQSSLY